MSQIRVQRTDLGPALQNIDQTLQLTATGVFDASANGSILTANWSSNNVQAIQFADVTSGIAQIVGQGTATITAQTSSGTGTLTITVGP